ncbi:Uncharacterized conserved protein YndB, AHSA1/START domain [Reichenbachiella faecimaris]|uniref:Uncharacterized conserved protein YndB, AHSA1/START domain n=1 Tax=Reichenbachiella faecimaris TaxID=692418 RepID=A0A1W2GIY0_REIFA|nr:SRPBCC domain-containing protein [Reichenbachiella faecimaris]SMD36308.1 Uncharacterized conserved protein YndB, AHSA1/START domain [Reichenbachiella faecimaris]
MNDRIEKEYFLNAPIHKVWNAISLEKEINEWFIQADFKAEVGYQYTFTHESTRVTGEVLEVNPVYDLVYTWIVGGTTEVTTVRWSLESKADGTMLKINHWGFSNYPKDSAVAMFDSSVEGWDAVSNWLKEYIKN